VSTGSEKRKPSASKEESEATDRAVIAKLSVRERMELALRLGREQAALAKRVRRMHGAGTSGNARAG